MGKKSTHISDSQQRFKSDLPQNFRTVAFSRRKYQEGLLALEKSFQINPDDRSTVIAMIAALRRTGQEERAQEFLKKMNEMPTDPRE